MSFYFCIKIRSFSSGFSYTSWFSTNNVNHDIHPTIIQWHIKARLIFHVRRTQQERSVRGTGLNDDWPTFTTQLFTNLGETGVKLFSGFPSDLLQLLSLNCLWFREFPWWKDCFTYCWSKNWCTEFRSRWTRPGGDTTQPPRPTEDSLTTGNPVPWWFMENISLLKHVTYSD